MGDLSEHFNRSEFACKCGCGFDTVDFELIDFAEKVRAFTGPISPTSGCRCEEHNASVGGAPRSQHLRGRAADFPVADPETRQRLYHALDAFNPGGLFIYDWGIHVDTRSGPPARGDYREGE